MRRLYLPRLNFNNSLTVSTKPWAEAMRIALNPSLLICFGEIPVLTGEICYLQCLVYKVLVQPTKKNGVSIERCLHQSWSRHKGHEIE
jgi:hypothetical protein